MQITGWLGYEVPELRREVQHGRGYPMRLRRGVVVSSLLGIASMGIVTLFQSGIIAHLPDPKRGNFHSDKVNSSDEAYSYGGPDAPVTIVAQAMSLLLATLGGADRGDRHPWLPLVASGVAGAQAAMAAKYLFYQMPKVDRAWCPYCIFDALTHFATFLLTLPEASRAAVQGSVRAERSLLRR